jgi:hypothetical protein
MLPVDDVKIETLHMSDIGLRSMHLHQEAAGGNCWIQDGQNTCQAYFSAEMAYNGRNKHRE